MAIKETSIPTLGPLDHFDDAVAAINNQPLDLQFLFGPHGDAADGDNIVQGVPSGAIVLLETEKWDRAETVYQLPDEGDYPLSLIPDHIESFQDVLFRKLAHRKSVIVPFDFGGFRQRLNENARKAAALSSEEREKEDALELEYIELQRSREMMAAVGGIAFLAEAISQLGNNDPSPEAIVGIYGTHHRLSLPALLGELGISRVTSSVLRGNEHKLVLPINPNSWPREDIDAIYTQARGVIQEVTAAT